MEETVQETIQQLITPLIRALGPSHGKLLTLLRTFPPGAESLALRVLTIFTETARPSAQLVALVKGLISERDLDARFLIPIIAEMDKVRAPTLRACLVQALNKRTMLPSVWCAFAGGYLTASAPHCVDPQREARAQEPGQVRLQLRRYRPAPGVRQRQLQPAARAAERTSHPCRTHGASARVRKGNRPEGCDRW
jgi:hypothetical protein